MAKHFRKKQSTNGELPTEPAVAPRRDWTKSDWLEGLILCLALFLIYLPMWWAGYIWDDEFHLTANPCIVGPLGLKEIWTTQAASICPFVFTTFWVEHALWGLAPLPYQSPVRGRP